VTDGRTDGRTDRRTDGQTSCHDIVRAPFLVKRNVSQFVHNNSSIALKVITVTYRSETHHSKCPECLFLVSRHAIKQSCYWSVDWSMKLCWLSTIFQSDAISAHGHTSLVSDKHVPAFHFQSVCPGAGALVWFSCSQGWKWMVHRTIAVMSCCSNSCCHTSVKLLVTFTFQCTTRAQNHTRLRNSHQTCGLIIDQTSVL